MLQRSVICYHGDMAGVDRRSCREASAVPDQLEFRPIVPADKAALEVAFRRLSADSRRRRFHFAKKQLSDEELRRLTECDGDDAVAIIATWRSAETDTVEIVGVVRFARLERDVGRAEVSIAVIDEWQRRGVGARLMAQLVTAAAASGVTRIEGVTQPDNRQLRALLDRCCEGAELRRDGDLTRFSYVIPPVDARGA
jgi:RimJ/RimL family protein N-acetyltransferase